MKEILIVSRFIYRWIYKAFECFVLVKKANVLKTISIASTVEALGCFDIFIAPNITIHEIITRIITPRWIIILTIPKT